MRRLLALLLLPSLALAATGQRAGVSVEADVSNRRVTSTGGTTARALKDHLSGLVPEWGEAAFPMVLGHRGSGSVAAPENTIAAMDFAAAIGVPLETDVQSTADGVLVLLHDSTTDRTTGTTGSVAIGKIGFAQARTLDASYILPGPGNVFVPQRIPTFEEYLRRYGRTNLLIPEIKDESTVTATKMATAIRRLGLTPSVAVQAFSLAPLQAVKAVDSRIRTVYTSVGQVPVATAVTNGYWAVFISQVNITQQYVADMHAAGVKVFAWTVNEIAWADTMLGYGVDAIASDDPLYMLAFATNRTPTGTTTVDAPPTWFAAGGWKAYASISATPTVASGFSTFTGVGTISDGSFFRIQVPLRTADAPASQTITTTLKAAKVNATTTRWFGVRFGWTTDGDMDWMGSGSTRGYHFIYRRTGAVEISRIVAGAGTTIATASGWPAIAEGDTVKLKIETTATAITVTLLELNGAPQATSPLTVSDAVNPRGGLIMAIGSGVAPGIGTTTVTY